MTKEMQPLRIKYAYILLMKGGGVAAAPRPNTSMECPTHQQPTGTGTRGPGTTCNHPHHTTTTNNSAKVLDGANRQQPPPIKKNQFFKIKI